jgi:hypothetical protein
MNWGKGIALAMACFIGMMAFFFVKAAQSPEPLVTEDYYAEELVYQQRIDATQRADALEAPVQFEATRTGLRLRFPASVSGAPIQGRLKLLRMDAPEHDRDIVVEHVQGGIFTTATTLLSGPYAAQLDWSAGDTTYASATRLIVP